MATIDKKLGQLDVQLDQWTEKPDALVSRVEGFGYDVAEDHHQRFGVLRTRYKAATWQIADAKTASSDNIINDLDGTMSDVESRFFRVN